MGLDVVGWVLQWWLRLLRFFLVFVEVVLPSPFTLAVLFPRIRSLVSLTVRVDQVTPSLTGEKMQVVGTSHAGCGEGEATSCCPLVLLYLSSFPALSPAGASLQGEGSHALPAPEKAWGHRAHGRRDSGSAPGFWGQHGGSHRTEHCWGLWDQHHGCAWLHVSCCAGAALAVAAGKLVVQGCGCAECRSWGCR